MKNIFTYIRTKLSLRIVPCIFIIIFTYSCTDNFEDYNRDPGQPTDEEINEGNYLVKIYLPKLINYAYPVQENNYQLTENFIGGIYGRYFNITKPDWRNHFQTFNAIDTWIYTPMKDVYQFMAGNFFELEALIKDDESRQHLYALAKILKVTGFQRVTDMYGPIPYSKLSTDNLMPEYDDQETIYRKMFEELDEAIAVLTQYYKDYPNYERQSDMPDNIYGNNYKKWVVYANTLKLRMAMRVRFADPELAKQKAESAVNHEWGVMNSNEDNAYNSFVPNGLYKSAVEWDDARACADIICYMDAFGDPRLEKYFKKGLDDYEWGDYVGIRSGIIITSRETAMRYSAARVNSNDKMLIMPASESYFLRAEGALIGWDMGGTAQEFYEKGMLTSLIQWGVDDEGVDWYVFNNDNSGPNSYYQPDDQFVFNAAVNYRVDAKHSVNVKWDDSADQEVQLEQIMTQKWIALYPIGQEAWSEQRRTGYPRFFPVLVNLSDDPSLTENLASRIPYPNIETKKTTYGNVLKLLGGEDNYSTRLWWDKNPNKIIK